MNRLERITMLQHSKQVLQLGILAPLLEELIQIMEAKTPGEEDDEEQINLAQRIDALQEGIEAINIIIKNLS